MKMLMEIKLHCMSSQRPGLSGFLKSWADVNELSRDLGWALKGPFKPISSQNRNQVKTAFWNSAYFKCSNHKTDWRNSFICCQLKMSHRKCCLYLTVLGEAAGCKGHMGGGGGAGALITLHLLTTFSFCRVLEIATLSSPSWQKLYKSRGTSLRNLKPMIRNLASTLSG